MLLSRKQFLVALLALLPFCKKRASFEYTNHTSTELGWLRIPHAGLQVTRWPKPGFYAFNVQESRLVFYPYV